jgi:hypothetical protein
MSAEIVLGDGSTVQDVADALAYESKGKKIVVCPSIGDAASPVYLRAGGHTQQLGQCADYRHEVAAYAAKNGYLSVIGYYSQVDGWCCTISTDDTDVIDSVRDRIKRIVATARQTAEAEAKASRLAARAAEDAVKDAANAFAQRIVSRLLGQFCGTANLFGYQGRGSSKIKSWKWATPLDGASGKAMVLLLNDGRYLYGDDSGRYEDITARMK